MSARSTEPRPAPAAKAGVGRLVAAWLVALLAACDDPGLDVRRGAGTSGLNGWFELVFDAPVRALSVSRGALAVRGDDGRDLDVALRVDGRVVAFALRVDAALVADPPREIVATLAGGASVHALSASDGRRLAADRSLRWALPASLTTSRAEAPAIRGLTVTAGRARVAVDGVLDPTTLDADALALVPAAGGLVLEPLRVGELTWRVVGETTEVSFDVAEVVRAGSLQFDPRRVRWADVEGRRLRSSPPIDVEVRAGGP